MKLLSARISGFRRFGANNRPLDLSDDLVAIVGPNESGKSSLLNALTRVNDSDAIELADLTRGGDGTARITVRYAVEDNDRQFLATLFGSTAPRGVREFSATKLRKGSFEIHVVGDVPATANLIAEPLRTVRKGMTHVEAMYEEGPLESINEFLAEVDAQELPERASDALLKVVRNGRKPSGAEEKKVREALVQLVRLAVADVGFAMALVLHGWRPRFLLFSPSDRELAASYPLNNTGAWTDALYNLFALAELDGDELAGAAGNVALVKTRLHGPNRRIQEKMNAAWRQGQVTVRLEVDGQTLHVLAYEAGGGSYLPITSRSEGLRQFLAIMAFVERHKTEDERERPILLLDEAEQHLHYDAQADLVNVLTEQQFARKVIYTTHSAGCLPSDLGTGVRALTTTRSSGLPEDADDDLTVPENRFWHMGGAGYNPLLLAMGATTFAFTATRRAVITEGFADLLLLPSMIREATKESRLDYQVVPGLARVADGDIAELADTAVNVAFLVDGDAAGEQLQQRLLAAGIPKRVIVSLGAVTGGGHCEPEDLLDRDVFVAAVNEMLRDAGAAELVPADVPERGRWSHASKWAATSGAELDKRRFASAVLERRTDGLLSAAGRKQAPKLHRALTKALQTPRRKPTSARSRR